MAFSHNNFKPYFCTGFPTLKAWKRNQHFFKIFQVHQRQEDHDQEDLRQRAGDRQDLRERRPREPHRQRAAAEGPAAAAAEPPPQGRGRQRGRAALLSLQGQQDQPAAPQAPVQEALKLSETRVNENE